MHEQKLLEVYLDASLLNVFIKCLVEERIHRRTKVVLELPVKGMKDADTS